MKEVYLDNAATTKPLDLTIEAVSTVMRDYYGNPSSLHKKGIEAENKIKECTTYFANVLGCTEDEIYYTSGGTESNNLAILGTAWAYHKVGKRILTTAIEHPSVGDVFKHLETQGFEVLVIPVDEKGYIGEKFLEEAINEDTTLVSIMHVNNEIGTIQDIERIGKLIKTKNPKTFFHVDAVQSFTKVPISVRKAQIDLLSISGHKFYGPRGVGLFYKSKKVRVLNQLHGGGQQKNLRSGTENVPAIYGMYVAARYAMENQQTLLASYLEAKTYLAEHILGEIEETYLNGDTIDKSAPHILNIGFKDVRAEVLLHALEQHQIYVSSGSACASNKVAKSGTLAALGLKDQALDSAIRFSFSKDITKEDLDYCIDILKKQVALLRKFTLGGKKR
ncbi:cysteine desulfurase family protein [Niameybacter massiliensis]|uniref:Cysteine desulfurase family protein n=1 Tax=Holtiella tumoricola TaxID=3018743 RepID=A0AA42DRJ4_9FIRM|nr:cysteine desulfurase family protein [Holtiella tumoricola]MDA3733618.1 cysteine desulfurase family protein [Holtiella tumoricola]